MSDHPPSVVIRRRLAAAVPGGLPVLDAVLCPEPDGGATLRVFTRAGVRAGAFDPAPRAGCARLRELREVSGAVMAVADASPARIALAGGGVARVEAARAEWDLFAGATASSARGWRSGRKRWPTGCAITRRRMVRPGR